MLSSKSEQYEFVDYSGNGMFGMVDFFERQRDKKIVAVKRLARYDRRMAIREARFLSALTDHKAYKHHIVRFYEYFSDDFNYFIVVEALDQNLTCYQKTNAVMKFEIRDIRTVAQQLLIALAKLEDLGIVHTDVKQDNIMLVNQARQPFRVKLADFGAALTAKELTEMWTPYIQPRFVRAPEVLLACKCSGKVDVWSLGCVLGEMAIGRMLFPSLCDLELAHSIFGTRGLPSSAMMKSGIKTKMLFDRVETRKGVYGWQLKPYKGKQLLSRTQSLRKFAPANLEVLRTMEDLEGGSEEQDSAELADRNSLLDLLYQTLVVDPEQRASPSQALNLPFLTLKHLSGCAKQSSVQCYKAAGVALPQGCTPSSSDSSEASDPDVPKQERRPARRTLRSFFSCLFSCRSKKKAAVSQGKEDLEEALEGPSSAVHGGRLARDAQWQQLPSPQSSTGTSASESEESSTKNSESNLAPPEGPPKKRGFLKWLRTRFPGCRRKKSTPGSDSSLQGSS